MLNKKGQALDNLQGLIVPLIGVCIVLAIGFLIIAEAKDQVAATDGVVAANCSKTGAVNYSSAGCNASREVQNALAVVPGWLPIIIITVIGAILIGLVSRFQATR